MLEIHGFHGVLSLESQTEMEVQNFYWKGVKFAENIHVILQKVGNFEVCHRDTGGLNKCIVRTYGQKVHLGCLKFLTGLRHKSFPPFSKRKDG